MSVVGLIYALFVATQLVFVVLSLGFTRLVGIQVREVMIGSPGLVKFHVRSVLVKVGVLPASSIDMVDFEQQPLARKLVVRIGPWAAQLGVALALLGPGHALRSFGRAFGQVLFAADPAALVERFVWLVKNGPLPTVLGILLAKVVAFNLLPLTMLAGGAVVDDLLFAVRGKRAPMWLAMPSLLIMLVLAGRWLWALVGVMF